MNNELPSAARLSVSIVLYHSSVELLRATLTSLASACHYAFDQGQLKSAVVAVVDNSQCYDYRESVENLIAEVGADQLIVYTYTATPDNSGFGAGHNSVLPLLDSDVHLILNPDVELNVSAVSAGLGALGDDNSLTLLSPKVLAPSGHQEFLCKSYPSVLVLLLRAFAPSFVRHWFRQRLDDYELRDLCKEGKSADVLLVSGCFMLLRTSSLVEAAGFSEKYFLYFEDFDLSLRLAEKGRLLYLPAMQITHHGGYAAGKGGGHISMFVKSGFQFFNDHGWKWI